ncbi:DUF2637 domain-containing protein [Streptomyces sp. NPDC008141]|uniref:DUF2637 domain-containing protein n=1 Tax=Streptomyces sp. NPDC008141 TaxID=3364815 RepID=UPI0036E1ED09
MSLHRRGRAALVLALVAVVAMAFRVSWNALRDIANAVGADDTAAMLYPFVVDGLMALALVATLVLAGRDRTFALRVLGTYTVASLVLNYVHGLVPKLHDTQLDWTRLADWDPANWALVLLATSLPVGSIYFGSDLVAKVLHHRPAPITVPDANAEESTEKLRNRSTADLAVSTPAPTPALPVRMPDPVTVDFLKSTPLAKHLPTPAPTPVAAIERRPVAAESTRPRRATGRVPEVARSARPRRTAAQLLDEARSATADWVDGQITAEGIRRTVRTSPANARMLRDTLLAERAAKAA